jgi:hypothetical protein
MPQRGDTERLEILQGQFEENLLIDIIGLERLCILAETERFEPSWDIHHRVEMLRARILG